jgi:hypothetical protein
MSKGMGVDRPKAPGNPRTGGLYPKAMEQGRMIEQSLGDAANEVKQVKQDLMDKIKNELSKAIASMTAELPDSPRPGALIPKVIAFIKQMKEFIEDVVAVIQAIQQCIAMLWTMLANLRAMIQSCLNALANLLAELCNWSLPDLPSLPNLFGMFMDFPGFNLPDFKGPLTGFPFNFSMKDCHIHLPNLDIFRNQPLGFTITGLDGKPIFHLPDPIHIPWSGQTITLKDLDDPVFRASMEGRFDTPVYSPDFNPKTDTQGSVVDPSKIIDNYHLTKDAYQKNLLSMAFPDLIPSTSDPDYSDFNPETFNHMSPISSEMSQAGVSRVYNIRETLRTQAVLDNIVDSNWDPNLVMLWINYLVVNMEARRGEGLWIPANAKTYAKYITPSYTYLKPPTDLTTDVPFVPYNNVLDGPGVRKAPESIPLIQTKDTLGSEDLRDLLWRLSYVEAGLLGIDRNTRWDPSDTQGMIPDWKLSTRSGSEDILDVPVYADKTTSSVSLPYDKAWLPVMSTVIAKGRQDIQEHTTWETSRPQWKYIYNEFAEAHKTDRFIQYWKEFESNWNELMGRESHLVDFVMHDWSILDSAVNPLGDPSLFNSLKSDFHARDLSWEPGYPIPFVPRGFPTDSSAWTPTDATSGWDTSSVPQLQTLFDSFDNLPTDPEALADRQVPSVPKAPTFDIQAFLARPDVRALPLAQQMAMLEIHQSYASLMQSATTQIQAGLDAIADQQRHLAEAQTCVSEASAASSLGVWSGVIKNASAIPDIDSLLPSLARGPASKTSKLPAPQASPVQGTSSGSQTSQSSASDSDPMFVAGEALRALTAVVYGADRRLHPLNPTLDTPTPTLCDGVQVASVALDGKADPVLQWGSLIPAKFTPGDLVFVGSDGALTQDYAAVKASCKWLYCIGRALDGYVLYEPHIPTKI